MFEHSGRLLHIKWRPFNRVTFAVHGQEGRNIKQVLKKRPKENVLEVGYYKNAYY
jgi:hypothetical protein